MNGIKGNTRKGIQQDIDLVLKNFELKIIDPPSDEVLLTTDKRYNNYKANEDRNILRAELFRRKYFGEIGNVKYYQNLIPKQLVSEVLRRLHREF